MANKDYCFADTAMKMESYMAFCRAYWCTIEGGTTTMKADVRWANMAVRAGIVFG